MSKVSAWGGRGNEGRSEGYSQEGTTPRQNITKEEQKAITELKKDNTRIILTADTGVSLVVLNKEDYVKKADELLHQPTYRTISSDPTTK